MAYQEKNIKTHNENEKRDADPGDTPVQAIHLKYIDSKNIRIFRDPWRKLRLTIDGDRSYLKVKVVQAAPLSYRGRYICFLDAKDGFICMLKDLSELDANSRQIVLEELNQRYLTSVINRIYSLKSEFGVSYWEAQTNRGRREFVMKDVAESAQWLSENRLLLIDIDGNRFEIPEMNELDDKSVHLIETVL